VVQSQEEVNWQLTVRTTHARSEEVSFEVRLRRECKKKRMCTMKNMKGKQDVRRVEEVIARVVRNGLQSAKRFHVGALVNYIAIAPKIIPESDLGVMRICAREEGRLAVFLLTAT